MKISQKSYSELKEDMQKILCSEIVMKKLDDTIAAKMKNFPHMNEELLYAWNLFHIAGDNRGYDDNHHGYITGLWDRILPYSGFNWSSKLYSEGLNDSHIETAIKRIWNEIKENRQ